MFALVYSVAQGTRKITTNAEALHDADETLRMATVARAQIAVAVIISNVDREFGTISTDAIGDSMAQVDEALDNFDAGLRELSAAGHVEPALAGAAAEFLAESRETVDLLAEGDPVAARDYGAAELDPAFSAIQEELTDKRAELDAAVSASDRFLQWLEQVARFLVAFLVPTAVIILYREFMRRQQRQIELEGRLATERALGKAREDFIANASHELRTPLTSIYGLALLLEEDDAFDTSDTARDLLDMIISESADLSRMVEDLLTTARLDAGALHYTFENVAVGGEIEEVVGPMTRAGLDIETQVEPATVRADRLRLRQVLRNLLSNARKYGGPHIRVEGSVDGTTFVFSVTDDGDGIPLELEERLFQRFLHQGHQPMVLGSVGLGLSIVRALAEGMGGAVAYERVDGWTRFSVRLPLVASGDALEAPSVDDLFGLGGSMLSHDSGEGSPSSS